MALPDIRLLVPHSDRMVLLDRVVAADVDSLCAETTIRDDSLFYTEGGVGAWVGLEYMAQTIAAYAGYAAYLRREPIKPGFVLGTRRFESQRPMFPLGSVLQIYAMKVLQNDSGLGSFDCRIEAAAGTLATASLTVHQPAEIDDFLRQRGR
ncbi:MAG: 3-hydroxylacyl-ACP dehydratase [Deltaproteobacteria bacterium]|nr:3-hydroxylacyl-ACP dehydratase [Deltaproteobacteria bacterium]